MRRVSVDIGGTFTDCFLAYDGKYIEAKAHTTHHNLASGFMEALGNACGELNLSVRDVLSSVDAVRYATTLGTNASVPDSRASNRNIAMSSTSAAITGLTPCLSITKSNAVRMLLSILGTKSAFPSNSSGNRKAFIRLSFAATKLTDCSASK